MLVVKANGKVRLYLDPARPIKVLIIPIHGSLMLNDKLPRLAGMKYFTLIDGSLEHYNLKLDDKLSYSTAFSYSFSRY